MGGEQAVDHDEIGIDELIDAEILLDQGIEKMLRLEPCGKTQAIVEGGVLPVVDGDGVEAIQAHPLAQEALGQRPSMPVRPACGRPGHGAPLHRKAGLRPRSRAIHRQASGSRGSATAVREFDLGQGLFAGAFLQQVEKARRTQDHGQAGNQRLLDRGAVLTGHPVDFLDALKKLGRGRRSPEGAFGKFAQQPPGPLVAWILGEVFAVELFEERHPVVERAFHFNMIQPTAACGPPEPSSFA